MKILQKKLNKTNKAFISIFAIFFSAIIVSVLTAMYVLIVKQIEIMNLDYSSFQSMYTADSAFECILYKEIGADTTNSILLPDHFSSSDYCETNSPTSDMSFESGKSPVVTNNRSKSVLDIKMDTDQGKFCGVITADRIATDPSGFSTAPDPNFLSISGQSRDCTDSTPKVVERVIEFFY